MSIELFEHLKNYPMIVKKVSTWLAPGGFLFLHIFCHKDTPYHFEEDDGWMSKNFFSGGVSGSKRDAYQADLLRDYALIGFIYLHAKRPRAIAFELHERHALFSNTRSLVGTSG